MEFFVVQIAPGPPYECIYTWGGNMSLKNKFFFLPPSCAVAGTYQEDDCIFDFHPRKKPTVPSGRESKQLASVFTTFCYYCVILDWPKNKKTTNNTNGEKRFRVKSQK